MESVSARYGRRAKGHTTPYGTLANASYELRQAFYYYGYRHDDDLPPLPEVNLNDAPVVDPEEELARVELRSKINEVFEALPPRHARVLRMRYELDWTLDEVGVSIGVTKERVRQIEAHALRTLKHPRCSDLLRDFCRP
jgi:RNA polymerase sigma factor (sigma-70 family)